MWHQARVEPMFKGQGLLPAASGIVLRIKAASDAANVASIRGSIAAPASNIKCVLSDCCGGLRRRGLNSQVKETLKPPYQIAAQNSWARGVGAYTGEIAPELLVDLGIGWVILGHSERRSIIGESSELVRF